MNTIDQIEKVNSGSSPTKNSEFDKDGYLLLKNIQDVSCMIEKPPKERGQFLFNKKGGLVSHCKEEMQVEGSLSRYNYPQYVDIHTEIRKKVEKIIGCELYNTYFYDRFYFKNQELKNHIDRDSCEISVSLHISSGPIPFDWAFGIKSAQGGVNEVILKPGDGILYKGCERPHWRKKMPRLFTFKSLFYREQWYHQVFFHYVLANGVRAHFAYDS